jgi:hypothetical protein
VHDAPVRIGHALVVGLVLAGCGPVQPAPSTPSSPPASVEPPSATSAAEPGPDAWVAGVPAPIALTEVAATAHRGEIWVAGGLDADGHASDRVLVFDPVSQAWSEGPRVPEPIHHAALVSDGTGLFLLGGYAGDGFDRPTDLVRMLRRPADPWLDHSRMPEPRAAGGAAWDGQRLVYGGGVGPSGATATVFVDESGAWTVVGRLSEAREHLAATSDGVGSTFFLGGRLGGLEGNRAAVDALTEVGVRRRGELPTPRGGVAAFWWPSLGACLAGGESPTGTNAEVECIHPSGGTRALPDLGAPRHGLGAAVVEGRAYVVLGGPQPGLFVSDAVEVLELPA